MSSSESHEALHKHEPLLPPDSSFASVTDKIASIVLARQLKFGWLVGFGISFALTMLLFLSIVWLFV